MQWNIDTTHAGVNFSVKHLAIATVRGAFNVFSGTGETDAQGFPTAASRTPTMTALV